MSVHKVVSVIWAAAAGLVGGDGATVPADPAVVRRLLADMGMPVGPSDADLADAVREFQDHMGLRPDGFAGPRTVHVLAHYADEARELREFAKDLTGPIDLPRVARPVRQRGTLPRSIHTVRSPRLRAS